MKVENFTEFIKQDFDVTKEIIEKELNKPLEALNKIWNSKSVDSMSGLEFAYIYKEELEIIREALKEE